MDRGGTGKGTGKGKVREREREREYKSAGDFISKPPGAE
jgi:quercetin dioxygenase-like cupin family protein